MIDPPPRCAHLGPDRLGGEELMAEIHRHRLVPVIGGDGIDLMAIVARRIVDEDADQAEIRLHAVDRLTQGVDVGQIARDEHWSVTGRRQTAYQRLRRALLDVDEGHPGSLSGKGFDHRRADARPATGDEDHAAIEAGIVCE